MATISLQGQRLPVEPPKLDAYVDSVLKTFEVPGLCIALVQNGKVILAKGYGVKKLGTNEPVTPHTLFSIASNSKAFTAAALEILVEEKKIRWDDPVIRYLPEFRMSDPWVTAQITIRDLLVHHSGITAYAGDFLLFPPSDYTRMELLAKLEHIPLTRGFRTTYAYDNILYLAAGEIVKRVSGMEWEDFVRTRVLERIGMSETEPRFSAMKNHPDIASSHARSRGIVKVDEHYFDQALGDVSDPAGGIASNAVDMSKWLLTQLDSGRAPNGNRIFQAAATNDLWQIVTPIPIGKTDSSLAPARKDFFGYALGFRIYNYGKYKVIGHGGKLDGFVSQVAFVPELKLGIAVLTNQESTGAYWSIIYHLFDHYMHNPRFNWIAGFKKEMDSSMAEYQRAWRKANIVPSGKPMPALSPAQYAGRYYDTLCGEVSITRDTAGLVLRFKHCPQFVADLVPFQYETFLAKFRNPDLKADSYLTFTLSPDGKPERFTLQVIDPDSDLSFDGLVFKTVK
ncbi:MAG TPA: serine hydrolase [Puia sp.]|nr:serine hydrolase [Puia sp.]